MCRRRGRLGGVLGKCAGAGSCGGEWCWGWEWREGVFGVTSVVCLVWRANVPWHKTRLAPLYHPDTLVNPDTCLGLFHFLFYRFCLSSSINLVSRVLRKLFTYLQSGQEFYLFQFSRLLHFHARYSMARHT